MSHNFCPSVEQLQQFAAGTLEKGAEMIAAHLDQCDACLAVVDGAGAGRHRIESTGVRRGFAFRHEPGYQRAEQLLRAQSTRTLDQTSPPTRLGDYEILAIIGRGGMGTVYKARHSRLNQLVAIKVLPYDRLHDEQAIVRFRREMNAVGGLKHPNIVIARDAGEWDGEHYLVMELLEGSGLSALAMNDGQLRVSDACELIRQASLGLHHAHQSGVIHRDIKPSNLMLCRDVHGDPVVKIVDMGLARFSDRDQPCQGITSTGQMMGTLEYMAPEQGANAEDVDHRADVYSMGATLYKLLCGHGPYGNPGTRSLVQFMHLLANEPPQPVGRHRRLPHGLVALIDAMVARNPDDRPKNLKDVAESLSRFSVGHNVAALIAPADPLPATGETEANGATVEQPSPGTCESEIGPVRSEVPTSGDHWRYARFLSSGVFFTLLVALSVFLITTRHGIVRVEITGPGIEVAVDAESNLTVRDGRREFKVSPGLHRLQVNVGETEFFTKDFEVKRGEDVVLRVSLVDGNAIRVTRDGMLLSEQRTGDSRDVATEEAVPANAVHYGDRVYLTTWGGVRWLSGNQSTTQMVNGQEFHRVRSVSGNEPDPDFAWTIRSSFSGTEERTDVVRFGDEVLLTDGKHWLVEQETPLIDKDGFDVFGGDPSADTDRSLRSFKWRIQAGNTTSTSSEGLREFGKPVCYDREIFLGCRYTNNSADPPFDGYALLAGGCGAGAGVQRRFTKDGVSKQFHLRWIIRRADDSSH